MFGNFGKIDYSSSTSKNHPCFNQKLALNECIFVPKYHNLYNHRETKSKFIHAVWGNFFILKYFFHLIRLIVWYIFSKYTISNVRTCRLSNWFTSCDWQEHVQFTGVFAHVMQFYSMIIIINDKNWKLKGNKKLLHFNIAFVILVVLKMVNEDKSILVRELLHRSPWLVVLLLLQMHFHKRDEITCRFDSRHRKISWWRTNFPQMQSVLCIYGACITHIHETIKLQIKIMFRFRTLWLNKQVAECKLSYSMVSTGCLNSICAK